jgi:hypothetical protein
MIILRVYAVAHRFVITIMFLSAVLRRCGHRGGCGDYVVVWSCGRVVVW